jgi:hypothetical protein
MLLMQSTIYLLNITSKFCIVAMFATVEVQTDVYEQSREQMSKDSLLTIILQRKKWGGSTF